MLVAGLASLPESTMAQQTSLKDQLVGTWTLVSCNAKQPFCVNPSGSLSLDAGGRYILMTTAGGRPKTTTGPNGNRADVKPEDYKAVAQGVVAQFGTGSVNEADKTLTQQTEGALFPNAEGAALKFSVSLTGDELKLAGTDNPAPFESVYRRAKLKAKPIDRQFRRDQNSKGAVILKNRQEDAVRMQEGDRIRER
jgi:hypothetical protein